MAQRSKLFEFVILYHKEDRDAGLETYAIGTPVIQTVVAATEADARILAARAIPAERMDKLGEVEILIRPFV